MEDAVFAEDVAEVLALGCHAFEPLVVDRSGVREAAVRRLDAQLLSGEGRIVSFRPAMDLVSFRHRLFCTAK